MKGVRRLWLPAVVAGFCLAGASAQAAPKEILIACAPSNPSSQNWVPKAILIRIEPETDRVAVLDDFTLQVFESGVRAQIERPTKDRLKLDWKLIGAKNKQDRKQNVAFKMTINLKRMTFNYSAVAESSYVKTGSSSGPCLPLAK